jgi:hypothetical protein
MRGIDLILADPPARVLLSVSIGWMIALAYATYLAWRPLRRPRSRASNQEEDHSCD